MDAFNGIKFAREGKNAEIAGDRELSFTSDWQLLPIEAEGTHTIVTADLSTAIAPYYHNLGYPPVYLYWLENTSGVVYSGGPFDDGSISVTPTRVIYNMNYPIYESSMVGWKIHWKIFRRSLLKSYTAPVITETSTDKINSNGNGISIALPNKSALSKDLRDFSVLSSCRQLMIHQSGVTPYSVSRTLSFTASTASTGNTLVSTTSVFIPNDVGKSLTNTVDYTSAFITGYTSATTVTLDTTIGNTWDSDHIESDSLVRIEISHNLGYFPMYYAYLNSIDEDSSYADGETHWRIMATADDSYITASNTKLVFSIFYDNYKLAYVIFKDIINQNG